jgi:hypothetical protein
VTSTLDGPVLAVLASAGHPMTVGEIAAQTPRGSDIGVRRCLARLVEQGTVRATEMGRNRVHELNREHVAAQVAVLLAGLRLELWKRLRTTIQDWNPSPVYACAFGSAARGDGGPDSDIDILLVHTPFPGEAVPSGHSGGLLEILAGVAFALAAPPLNERQMSKWHRQVDDLRGQVLSWSGNPAQIIDVSPMEWAQGRSLGAGLFPEIDRDAIELFHAGPKAPRRQAEQS